MSTIFRDLVHVNGVTFNDPTSKPAGTGYWAIDDLNGWDRSPALDIRTTPIGGAVDGEEIATDGPAKARHVVVQGYVTCDDRASAEAAKDIISRDAFPTGPTYTLTRDEPVPKFLTVRVEGQIEFIHTGPTNFRFLVPVVAGDPFKYGAVALSDTAGAAGTSTGGRTYPLIYPKVYGTTTAGEGNVLTLVNTGNTASRKLFLTITGPLSNGSWRVSQETTGASVSFDIDVATTDTLTIDMLRGVALLDGYPIGGSIIGDFFTLVPGINEIKLFADYDPAVSITALGYSAWR